jgi:hypothetical protein
MPVIQGLTPRQRIAAVLRENPGCEYSMFDLAAEVGCDLSIVLGHCRALAESEKDVWLVMPGVRGRPALAYSDRKQHKP